MRKEDVSWYLEHKFGLVVLLKEGLVKKSLTDLTFPDEKVFELLNLFLHFEGHKEGRKNNSSKSIKKENPAFMFRKKFVFTTLLLLVDDITKL